MQAGRPFGDALKKALVEYDPACLMQLLKEIKFLDTAGQHTTAVLQGGEEKQGVVECFATVFFVVVLQPCQLS